MQRWHDQYLPAGHRCHECKSVCVTEKNFSIVVVGFLTFDVSQRVAAQRHQAGGVAFAQLICLLQPSCQFAPPSRRYNLC
jgi:hypothetical protein